MYRGGRGDHRRIVEFRSALVRNQRRQKRMEATQQRLAALRTRMDQMYEDKLDGKIDESSGHGR